MEYYELPLPEPTLRALSDLSELQKVPGFSAAGRAWSNLLVWLGHRALADNLSPEEVAQEGKLLRDLFIDLRSALSETFRKSQRDDNSKDDGVLLERFPTDYFERKKERCPVDYEALQEVAQAYLRMPSLSNSTFDWLIVNGFLRCFVEDYAELVRSGRAFGELFRWSYILSGGSPGKMYVLRAIGLVVGGVVNWIAFPALAVYFASIEHPRWALLFAGLTAAQLIARIVLLPQTIREGRKKRKTVDALDGLLNVMHHASGTLWSPTDLLARVRRLEIDYPGLFLMPLSSVLARAIQRDPDVLEMWLSNDDFVPPVRTGKHGST